MAEHVDYTTLYISDLDPSITRDDLRDAIVNEQISVLSTTVFPGRAREAPTTGIVSFNTREDADKAFKELNHLALGRTEISIMFRRQFPKGQRMSLPPSRNVFIKKVPDEWSAADVHSLLKEKFGPVESVRLPRGLDNKHRGYGFALFDREEDARRAIEASGQPMAFSDEATKVVSLEIAPFVSFQTRSKNWTNCYVRGFPNEWTQADVEAWASQVGGGGIQSCVVREAPGHDAHSACINFFQHEDAEKLVAFDGKRFGSEAGGKEVLEPAVTDDDAAAATPAAPASNTWVAFARQHMSRTARKNKAQELWKKKCNIYMTGFSDASRATEIETQVAKYGRVFSFAIHWKPRSGGKGSEYPRALIVYEDPEAASRCIAGLHEQMLFGGKLKVEYFRRNTQAGGEQARELVTHAGRGDLGALLGGGPGGLGVGMAPGGLGDMGVGAQPMAHTLGIPAMPDMGAGALVPMHPMIQGGQYAVSQQFQGVPAVMGAKGFYGGSYMPAPAGIYSGQPGMMPPGGRPPHGVAGLPAYAGAPGQGEDIRDRLMRSVFTVLQEDHGPEMAQQRTDSIVSLLMDVLVPDELEPVSMSQAMVRQYISEIMQ